MRPAQVLFVALTLLVCISTIDAQICTLCVTVQTAVNRYLESYRHNPVVDPSLDFPKIETHIGKPGGATDVAISFTNFEVIGIPGFVLTENKFTLIDGSGNPGTLNVTLFFPELILTGENYKIFGSIAGALPLHADGPFEIKFTSLTLKAHGLLYIKTILPSLDARVENVEAELMAEDLTWEMVNILGDLSDAFNEMMTEIGLDILGEFKDGINGLVARYLERVLNNLLPGGKLTVE